MHTPEKMWDLMISTANTSEVVSKHSDRKNKDLADDTSQGPSTGYLSWNTGGVNTERYKEKSEVK